MMRSCGSSGGGGGWRRRRRVLRRCGRRRRRRWGSSKSKSTEAAAQVAAQGKQLVLVVLVLQARTKGELQPELARTERRLRVGTPSHFYCSNCCYVVILLLQLLHFHCNCCLRLLKVFFVACWENGCCHRCTVWPEPRTTVLRCFEFFLSFELPQRRHRTCARKKLTKMTKRIDSC